MEELSLGFLREIEEGKFAGSVAGEFFPNGEVRFLRRNLRATANFE